MHLIFHSCLGVFSVQTIYECVERLPSEPSVPKLYFMCVMCMPCSAVVNVCIWVGVSSLFCPHIFADRQTAQCNAAVFDRLINTGSGRRQQTQFVFRAETFKPPFPVTTLRGIMSFLQHSLLQPGSVFLPSVSTDMWSGCFTRYLYAKNIFMSQFTWFMWIYEEVQLDAAL